MDKEKAVILRPNCNVIGR